MQIAVGTIQANIHLQRIIMSGIDQDAWIDLGGDLRAYVHNADMGTIRWDAEADTDADRSR